MHIPPLFTVLLIPMLALAGVLRAAPVATAMDVAPTTLELTPGQPGLFYVANHGDRPIAVSIEGFDWTQPGGEDALAPSSDLVVSPPDATVGPGARQLVRVLAPAGRGERTYRLVVTQLADNQLPDTNTVRVLLRFGVPVFVGGQTNAEPNVVWRAARKGPALILTAHNTGAYTIKLAALTLTDAKGTPHKPDRDRFFYLLPGASRDFAFSGAADGTARIAATDLRSGHPISAEVAPP